MDINSVFYKKLLCFMKILMLLIFVLPVQLIGKTSYSQTTRFTLHMNNAKIQDVLMQIEEQSEFYILYNGQLVDVEKKVNISVDNQNIDRILDQLFAKSDVEAKIVGRQIVLLPAGEQQVSLASAAQQDRIITGVVTDEKGNSIPGVSIFAKGTTIGIVTDIDGRYSIKVPDKDVVLVFSFVGYAAQEIQAGARNSINVSMKEDVRGIDEVVVVGYGVQRKVNLTGSISQVTTRELENRSVATVAQMIQGTMPNVRIALSSGAPGQGGSIQIRGEGSLNGSDPLVLIDGVPGSLNRLNPSDVESISVLKDAASSAIYGARGAFGVVLVTTKQAKAGKTKITYDSYAAYSTQTTSTDFLTTAYDYLMINDVAFKRATGNTYTRYSEDDMAELLARRDDETEDPSRPWVVIKPYQGKDIYHYYGNYDWYKALYNKWRPSQYHNVNISGGSEKVNYMLSASYTEQDGMLKKFTEKHQAFTIMSKINAELTPWLKITNNIMYYDRKYTYPGMEGETNESWSNVNLHALPCYAPVNPDGTFTYNTMKNSYSIADGQVANLWGGVSKGKKGTHEFKETIMLEASVLKNLKLKADYSFQFYMADDWYRRGKAYYSIQPGVMQLVPNFNTDYYKKTIWYDPMHVANFYFSYNQTISDHTFGATAGMNYENKEHNRLMGQKYDLVSPTLNDLNLGTGDALATGDQYEYELFGAFFRVNYDYKGRYLLEFNGRYDGTSRFKSGRRFGFFPSVSGGWRLSEEGWFTSVKNVVNNLKVRASYGSLGNQLSGSDYYPYISSMAATLSDWLIDGEKTYNVGIPAPVANNLTWEKATTSNMGLDLGLFDNRLSFSGDYYIRKTTGMLVNGLSVPAVFGANSPKQNAGDMRTKGFEITLGWSDQKNVAGKTLRYGISVSVGDATSEITKYEANNKGLIADNYVGKKRGEIWGYRVDGLFQSDEEATEWNARVNQRYVNTRIYKSPGEWSKPRAGDVKFLDLDDNDKIHPGASTLDDPGDREIIGNTTPRYNFGINMNADWYGFDLSVFFQGIMHQDFYPGTDMIKFWGPFCRPYASFFPKDFGDDLWSEENKDAYFPQARAYVALDSNCELSSVNDRYLQNIGYVRLKNLVIGYTLPASLTRKICIERLRLYTSGENLFYLSPFRTKYIDPEEASFSSTGKVYPLSKVLSVGVNVTF